ncbi:MAG: hypothetical protein LBQ22_12245 [Bacteroidales bacterium]|jgi:CRISPR-associated protein Cmr5|nr:hypothetical protein [Bacteroidales bacterium]
MKLNTQMIQWAVEALDKTEIVKDNKYKSEFNGHISSLGAAIIQSGLLPAMIFFENTESEATDRYKVIKAVTYIINNKREYSGSKKIETSIAEYILKNPNDNKLVQDVTEAATSLKLALRMFKKEKND